MALTLKNYETTLSKDLLSSAKKNKVRECDETEKGHFVAYVDDGLNSFDVLLMVTAAGEIKQHTCDCDNPISFCTHKAALLIHIATDEKPKKTTIKARKKESKAEALLADAGPNELKDWVRALVAKNKDIELSFIHHFSVKEQVTPDEVTKTTLDTVKAVIGNKKAVDLTQLKKLVDLWAEMHEPVIAHYRANITDEKSFLNFHTVADSCLAFRISTETGSNKISKFVETILQKSQEPINNLYNEEGWDKAVGYFISQVIGGVTGIRAHYLVHLYNIIGFSSTERKLKIVNLLAAQFGKSKPQDTGSYVSWCEFVFQLVDQYGLFTKYHQLFKPLYYRNDYNLRLIDLLIENNHLETAEKYCRAQIKNNAREDFSVPYFQHLKQIYIIQHDDKNLTDVLAVLFPYTFQLEDFLRISAAMPAEEHKKWRTKMLSRARNASHYHGSPAITFCFELMDQEKSYRKMIDYIESYTPYSLILKYFEPMVQTEKNKLLEKLLSKSDDSIYMLTAAEKNDSACLPELFSLALKYYTADFLKAVIINHFKNQRYYIRTNRFIEYARQQLGLSQNN